MQDGRVARHQLGAAEQRYEAAANNLERCTAAKLVALAHEDAGDAGNAEAWRARETLDCQAALAEFNMGGAGLARGAGR
jgi:hypothetical protein